METINSCCCSRLGITSCLTIYSCGPNIPVGLGAVAVATVQLIADKIKKNKIEKAKDNKNCLDDTDYSFKIGLLNHRMIETKEKIRLFAISAIPFVGPWKVFSEMMD